MANLTKKELRHDAVHEELEKITVTVVKKRNSILLAVIVILALGLAVSQYAANKRAVKSNAENLLSQAGTNMVAITEVTTRYPGTHAAKTALLLLAKDACAATNYAVAAEFFAKVAKEYPGDECAEAASLAVARCKIGLGDFAAAKSELAKFAGTSRETNAKYLLFKVAAMEGNRVEAEKLAAEIEAASPEIGKYLTAEVAALLTRKTVSSAEQEAKAE